MNILLNVEKRHENSIWERSGYYLQKISNFYKTIKKCNFSKKNIHSRTVHPLEKKA